MVVAPFKGLSPAHRGKYAEGAVRKALNDMNDADLAFARWPDTHAGSRQPAPADFIILSQGTTILLEVKEVNHAYRLPYKNFPPDQRARMKSWMMAGARAYGLVYFTPASEWFLAGLDWFNREYITERDGKVVGSWDTSGLEKFGKKDLTKLLRTYL